MEPPPPINDCEGLTALTVTASPTRVRVNSAATLTAAGGSGRYAFKVAAGGSGGQIQGDRLVTGPTPGRDTVTASDDCANSATVDVDVIAAFSVTPARATIKPTTSFQVLVTGTLGTATFAAMGLGSGGSVSATGLYAAGPTAGLDLIAVRDSITGEEALVQYRVTPTATFRAVPPRLALPAGASARSKSADGSGVVTWAVQSGLGASAAASTRRPRRPPAPPRCSAPTPSPRRRPPSRCG